MGEQRRRNDYAQKLKKKPRTSGVSTDAQTGTRARRFMNIG